MRQRTGETRKEMHRTMWEVMCCHPLQERNKPNLWDSPITVAGVTIARQGGTEDVKKKLESLPVSQCG